jgi:hypothetical protein
MSIESCPNVAWMPPNGLDGSRPQVNENLQGRAKGGTRCTTTESPQVWGLYLRDTARLLLNCERSIVPFEMRSRTRLAGADIGFVVRDCHFP